MGYNPSPEALELKKTRRREKKRQAVVDFSDNLPRLVQLVLHCVVCEAPKRWDGEFWSCHRGHGKIATKEVLLRMIEEAIGFKMADVANPPFSEEAVAILANHAKFVGAHWSSARPGAVMRHAQKKKKG